MEYELYHHGILGQKWGQRRWQNEDGSLTPAGREHYGYDGQKKKKNETPKEAKKRIKLEAEAIKKSNASNREKAKVLSNMGRHSDSSEYYKKDFQNKRNAMIIGSLAFSGFREVGSEYLANKVRSGQMSYETGETIAKSIGVGKSLVQGYLTVSMIDSARKSSSEYWKFDKK